MLVSEHVLIGDEISENAEEILKKLSDGEVYRGQRWYAITTAPEDENLMYILSSTELRHSFYHDTDSLTLLGLAATKQEAEETVKTLIQKGVDAGEILSMKAFLKTM